MSANRTLNRSWRFAAAVSALSLALPWAAQAQQSSVQKPFESGRFEEVLQAASENRGDPATTFVAAQAALRMGQGDRAREELGRLESNDDRAWQLVAQSAMALLDDSTDEAVNKANDATGANGDNPYAHYQLGLARSKQGQHGASGDAFARAAELKSDFAYAHYYAGLEYQRARQMGKAGDHLRRFLDLAPDAPERGAVVTLLRTMRG